VPAKTKLKENVACLICYAGFWVTGIIFLVIEKKNKTVRFHAMQSLVVFGILNIIWGAANSVRLGLTAFTGSYTLALAYVLAATIVFWIFFTIWWVLLGVLMYRAYHNRVWKVPAGLGNLAEILLAKLDSVKIVKK
jgi:uncharacterized membrane protein